MTQTTTDAQAVDGTGPAEAPPFAPTWSGRRVSLTDPKADTINLVDVANGLAGIRRYAGCGETVATHALRGAAVIAAREGGPLVQLAFLVHDAPEYVFGELPRSTQAIIGPDGMRRVKAAHARLLDVLLAEVLCLPVLPTPVDWATVKEVDNACGMAEALEAGWSPDGWWIGPRPAERLVDLALGVRPAHPDGGAKAWLADLETLVEMVFEAAARG